MDLSNSSNLMENFTILDESEESENLDTDLDATDDVVHVETKPDPVIPIASDQEEQELEKSNEPENPKEESEEPNEESEEPNEESEEPNEEPQEQNEEPQEPNEESEKPPETKDQVIHPYAYLIESFEYQKEQVEVFEAGPVKRLGETNFDVIKTPGELIKMIGKLRTQREISIMMETQDRMKLLVLTIGTMEREYVIDVVKLSTSLVALTEIFVNPKIVKVVHNLARTKFVLHSNYHLYLVNVFDVKSAFFLKHKKHIPFNILISEEYGCDKVQVKMKQIMKGTFSSNNILNLRKGAHYLLYMYHNIKNELLSNDKEGYMALLEQMRKASMTLKYDSGGQLKNLKKQFMKYHQCELDVLQKIDDWRIAKFGTGLGSVESRLPKNDLVAIARGLPLSIPSLRDLISVTLSASNMNEILDIIKESRKEQGLSVKVAENNKKQNIPAVTTPPTQQKRRQTNNVSNFKPNMQNSRKRFKPNNMNNQRFSPGSSTYNPQNRRYFDEQPRFSPERRPRWSAPPNVRSISPFLQQRRFSNGNESPFGNY